GVYTLHVHGYQGRSGLADIEGVGRDGEAEVLSARRVDREPVEGVATEVLVERPHLDQVLGPCLDSHRDTAVLPVGVVVGLELLPGGVQDAEERVHPRAQPTGDNVEGEV